MNAIKTASWMYSEGNDIAVYGVEGAPLTNFAREKGIPVTSIQRHKKYMPFRRAVILHKIFKREQIDVIFIRDTRDIGIAALVKLLSGNRIKIIYHQAMQIGVDKKDLFHSLRFSFIDAWMSSTQIMKENVMKHTRFPEHKIHVVPLGVEVKKLVENQPETSEARKYFSLNQNDKVMGIMGRLNPMKGQHFLIECLEKIRNAGTDYHLLIVGEPTRNEGDDYKQRLLKMVKEKGLGKFVHFHGFLKEITWFLAAIDIFALASEKETYGMVTVESLVYGVPVIASNSGGTPEIINYGKYGKLYKPRDHNDFLNKFYELDQQKQKTEYLEEVRTLYSHTRQCELIENIIKQICN
jgi:glycosyltransferase involved in cell wall biosynthesis